MPTAPASDDRLIVALDTPTRRGAEELVERLDDSVSFYKIGLELLFSDGLGLLHTLRGAGKKAFLDLKFLDISNTVERAVAKACEQGADLLTLHAHDTATMQAAVRGRDASGSTTKLLGVTVLTSLTDADLTEQTSTLTTAELVLHRAKLAAQAGIDGVVASGQEAASVKDVTPAGFLIVTPGIRLPDDEAGDQQRIMTPRKALEAGATHLVIGRPITKAADPTAAARRFLAELPPVSTAPAKP